MDKNSKKQVAKISAFITSIFVIFLSVTYAFINMTVTGTKRQVITAGSLELELEEENAITINNAMPMYDEIGMIQPSFNFRLVNKTSEDTNYIVKLVDITDASKEKLDTSIVKYGLTKDGVSSGNLLSTLTDNQIDRGTISGNQTIHYSLRLWINNTVTDNASIKGKVLSYRIDVEVGQEIGVYGGKLKKREANEQWTSQGSYMDVEYTDFYQYSSSITSIALENKINIPSEISSDKIWDMSEDTNESVMAYIEEDGILESSDIAYKLHLQANGKIIANEYSLALFYDFSNLEKIVGFENLDVSSVVSFGGISDVDSISIFGNCPNLNLNLNQLDTSKVTNMSYMFASYNSSYPLDLSGLNTTNVTNMSFMFYDCNSLISLDLSQLDTSKVTDMSHIFYHCSDLRSLDLSSLNTSNVTNMEYMFFDCSSLSSLDVGQLDTSNVTDMSSMFNGCSGLTSLNLSQFDTSKVTDMSFMFHDCNSLTSLDLSQFDTSKVTDMSLMFYGCSNLTSLNLSNFDTSKIENDYDYQSVFDSIKNDCLITVKDDVMVSWVKARNSSLTNVHVKDA